MDLQPDISDFRRVYKDGRPQVVWTTLVSDLETPVSAFMKLAEGQPNSFLLESVEGGAVRGRYSFIGLKPDLIWRCFGEKSEINRNAETDSDRFEACPDATVESLKALVAESTIELPEGLPPMAAGLVGYMAYDTVRLAEHLPDMNPDVLDVPDGIFVRPTVMAVFDTIEDQVTLITPVRATDSVDADTAFEAATQRLAATVTDFDNALPHQRQHESLEIPEPASNMTHGNFFEMIKKAKEYILAGDIFQVVLSQRFAVPFKLPAFALYRSLRRLNPSPFLFLLNFAGFSVVGSSPEILVRVREGKVTIRPIAGTRP
ncbi:MAG: anthranilate synthase component I, partial [Rhodospirillaceae bacterium]|nr:anthranilate synthase component I [Rhodospirillaceae bacterium]